MDYRIIYVGAQTIFGILFLVLLALRHSTLKGQQANKLDAVYCLFLVTVVLDSIWILIDGQPELRTWHVLLQVVYLTAMAFTGYLWFLYTLDQFPAKSMKLRKYRFVLVIPVLIIVVLVFCSIKTSWMFVVDENGTYSRGDLHIFLIAMNYIYIPKG